MKIIKLSDVPTSEINMAGVKNLIKQIPIGCMDGSPNFSFRVFTIGKDGHTPFHSHPYEHINYIISGRGVIKKGEHEEVPIEKGYFSLILADEMHQYINKSNEPLVVICAVPKEKE
jgi:quercetin dioxygenase-like cupin family protein